jgi:hypothetical protein
VAAGLPADRATPAAARLALKVGLAATRAVERNALEPVTVG